MCNVIAARINYILQHRFRRAYAFARARLSPKGAYGLYLTLGAVALIGAAWLFGGISEDLITGDPLVQVDAIISEWFRLHATPRLNTEMQLASALASTSTVCILSSLVGSVLLWKRLWYRLLELVLVVAGGMLLNVLLKNLFDRARPGWADPVMALTDPSFPSGHTMMATIMYGFMAIYLMLAIASWRWRALILAATILLVFMVALSRMYLGAHYLSDVLAAMAAGMAWLALCLTAVEMWRRRRNLDAGTLRAAGHLTK
jgi:membrane-associated phospholipid phosphatase